MSRPQYDVKESYTGTGSLASYSFDFKITSLLHLLIIEVDDAGVETQRVRGNDAVYLDSVTFDPINGGGTVVLVDDLPADYKLLILLADDEPVQEYEFRNKTSFTLRRFEDAMDAIVGAVQRLAYRMSTAFTIHELDNDGSFDPVFPPGVADAAGKFLQVNEDGTGFKYGPIVEDLVGGGALPTGGSTGDFIEKDTTDPLQVVWKEANYDGISALTGAQFTSAGLKDTLDKIIRITYTPPTIVLSASPSQAVREKGDLVSSVDLSALITKKSNPIGAVRYYRNAVLVETEATPSPTGGTETFTEGTDFSDNMSFYAQVDDTLVDGNGPTTVQSNTVSFPFVYPYYSGAAAPSRTAAQVAALTKDIRVSTASLNKAFTTANGDVYYFAYPATYGALTSIKDVNNFETIGDWTLRTENITGLDASAVSYRIYEFNNPVVAGSTSYTFIR